MSNNYKSPIFPISEPQHFSDYGFDPQIDYFQVLEEARRHKKETSSLSAIDALSFKLQKPISRDECFSSFSKKKIKKNGSNNNKKRWWKNALLFFKWKPAPPGHGGGPGRNSVDPAVGLGYGGVQYCSGRPIRGSLSGPIYITESRTSGSSTPYRTTSRPTSGPLAGTLTPVEKDEIQIPYISLKDFEMDDDDHHHHLQQQRRVSTSAMPIYLVT